MLSKKILFRMGYSICYLSKCEYVNGAFSIQNMIVLKICIIQKVVDNRYKAWVQCILCFDNEWTREDYTDWMFEEFKRIPMLQILGAILDIISKFYPDHDTKP